MTIGWPHLKRRPSYQLLIAGGILVLILALILVWLGGDSGRLDSNPATGTQAELQKLAKTAAKLQANFSVNNPGKATKGYLSDMKDLQTSCSRLNSYYSAWQAASNQANADLFNQSHDLCTDLSKLASFTTSLYSPLQPLMLADTTPHRYQTLWPFAGHLRSSASKHTATALDEEKTFLAGRTSNSVDFPTNVVNELTTLKRAIAQSTGLGYLPALHTFQLRMLGERQLYWSQYAGLDSLQQELHSLTTN